MWLQSVREAYNLPVIATASAATPWRWAAGHGVSVRIATQDRDTAWLHRPELGKPKVLFMSSHFVSKLCQEAGGYDYSKVQRWTTARKLRRINITHYTGIKDVDKIIVPVHLGNHWVRHARARIWPHVRLLTSHLLVFLMHLVTNHCCLRCRYASVR
jgi:Ulp1 protease family, C-terminal catalytic domain